MDGERPAAKVPPKVRYERILLCEAPKGRVCDLEYIKFQGIFYLRSGVFTQI